MPRPCHAVTQYSGLLNWASLAPLATYNLIVQPSLSSLRQPVASPSFIHHAFPGRPAAAFQTPLHIPHNPCTIFKKKTILITGGASGVGLAAAQHLAHLGASRIILGVRSLEKGNAVAHNLSSISSDADLQVDVWELDMMSFDSVAKFAEKCKSEARRIDVAIMNAGKVSSKYELSCEWWESVLQVNVLSTALLSCLLLSQLVATAQMNHEETDDGSGGSGTIPHLVIVGSDAHYQAEFPERNDKDILASLNTERSLKGHEFDRYCVSKLFDLYIGIELAASVPRVRGSPIVVVNCVTPGFCASGLLAQSGDPPLVLRILQWLVARTPEKGALCYVDAAVNGEESHGRYLNHQKVWKPGELVTSEEGVRIRTRVWSEILDALEKVRPDIRSLLACHNDIEGIRERNSAQIGNGRSKA